MSLDYAILAFLEFEPMSGYELKKFFDQSITHFWSATQSHIYRSLSKMETAGWISHDDVEQDGKPDRKVYELTAEGEAALHDWLATPHPPEELREAWLIQIFFAHSLSNDQIATLFQARRDAMQAGLKRLQIEAQEHLARNASLVGVPRASALWQMTLDYGIATYEANIAWLDQALEKTRQLPPLTPPNP